MSEITGQCLLPTIVVSGNLRTRATVQIVAGALRPAGSVVLQFTGPPLVVVEWSVTEGSGTLEVEKDYTNLQGKASAIFVAEAPGPVKVQVRYGT